MGVHREGAVHHWGALKRKFSLSAEFCISLRLRTSLTSLSLICSIQIPDVAIDKFTREDVLKLCEKHGVEFKETLGLTKQYFKSRANEERQSFVSPYKLTQVLAVE